jgi:putative sigma-54 modulation protein
MRIDVVARNMDLTGPLKDFASQKAGKLTKYFDGIQAITVTLSKDDHHKHGMFGAELLIDVEKHDDFIAHEHDKDLYAAIDLVMEKGERQLRDYKERLKTGKR